MLPPGNWWEIFSVCAGAADPNRETAITAGAATAPMRTWRRLSVILILLGKRISRCLIARNETAKRVHCQRQDRNIRLRPGALAASLRRTYCAARACAIKCLPDRFSWANSLYALSCATLTHASYSAGETAARSSPGRDLLSVITM